MRSRTEGRTVRVAGHAVLTACVLVAVFGSLWSWRLRRQIAAFGSGGSIASVTAARGVEASVELVPSHRVKTVTWVDPLDGTAFVAHLGLSSGRLLTINQVVFDGTGGAGS